MSHLITRLHNLARHLLLCCAFSWLLTGCTIQPIQPESATRASPEVAIPEADAAATAAPVEESSFFSAEMLKNLTYSLEMVPAGSVQLTNGVYEDAANRVLVSWVDTYALGQLNGQPAAAVLLIANTGGSGTFSHLAVVVEQDGEPMNVTTLFLGDRLRMNWMRIANNTINLELVGQGPDEPMCCGTQRTRLSFALEGEQLVESAAEVMGVQSQITATQIITFVPTIIPDDSQPGSCFTNAITVGRSDAWRCMTANNLIYDPCFAIDDSGDDSGTGAMPAVVCGADPMTGASGFTLELTEPLPAPDAGVASEAWLVQLGDGTICEHLTGTVPGADGRVAPYGCADEASSYLMEDFLFFEPVYFVQRVTFDLSDMGFVITSSTRVPVTTMWR